MPDPRTLTVGDRIRFVTLPSEWDEAQCHVHDESRQLMELLIERGRPCRVARVDDAGLPWIDVRVRGNDGVMHDHGWCIAEHSGWIQL